MNLYVNEILEDPNSQKKHRVLWIDEGNVMAYLIDIFDERALPFIKSVREIKEEILRGELIKTKDDPFLNLITAKDLPDKYVELRDQAWNVIKEMVKNEPQIFEKNVRSSLTREAMEKYNVTYPAIRKYLRKYWQRGKTMNSLLPDYANSGGKGKERKPGEKKRGRPRKYLSTGKRQIEYT
ncbi:hypothetical protein [Tepidibacillus marianensis]|uniref:hypothetical protein n=1 Tax=Tepidibacillus marianensis TaxID=3131995 RepID=UPI0030CE7AF1